MYSGLELARMFQNKFAQEVEPTYYLHLQKMKTDDLREDPQPQEIVNYYSQMLWDLTDDLDGDTHAIACKLRAQIMLANQKPNKDLDTDIPWDNLKEIFTDHEWIKRIYDIYRVLHQKTRKTSTVFIYGKSNSGKTLLLNTFSSKYECGVILPMRKYASNFALADLRDRQMYIQEEARITDDNVQEYLLLMEGSKHLLTDVKNKSSQQLPKKPLIMTSNIPPEMYVSAYGDAINNRCCVLEMAQHVETLDTEFINITDEMLSKIDVYFRKNLCLSLCYLYDILYCR